MNTYEKPHANWTPELALFVTVMVAGAVVTLVAYHVHTMYLGNTFPTVQWVHIPWDSPVARPPGGLGVHTFSDFFVVYRGARTSHPYASELPLAYFPFTFVFFRVVSSLSYNSALIGMALGYAAGLVALSSRVLRGLVPAVRGLAFVGLFVLPYPLVFGLDRGNIDLAAFLLAGFGGVLVSRRPSLAAALIGCAAALKGFPVVLLIVFACRRNWRAFFVGIGVAVGFTAVSLSVLGGGLLQESGEFLAALGNYNGAYSNGEALNHGYSLWSLLTAIGALTFGRNPLPLWWMQAFGLVGGLALLGVLFWLGRRKPPAWEAAALAVTAMLVFSSIAPAYRLTLLLVALFMYFIDSENHRPSWFVPLLSILMLPKSLPVLRELVTTAVIVNSVLLSVLFVALVRDIAKPTSASLERGALEGPTAALWRRVLAGLAAGALAAGVLIHDGLGRKSVTMALEAPFGSIGAEPVDLALPGILPGPTPAADITAKFRILDLPSRGAQNEILRTVSPGAGMRLTVGSDGTLEAVIGSTVEPSGIVHVPMGLVRPGALHEVRVGFDAEAGTELFTFDGSTVMTNIRGESLVANVGRLRLGGGVGDTPEILSGEVESFAIRARGVPLSSTAATARAVFLVLASAAGLGYLRLVLLRDNRGSQLEVPN